MQQTAPSSAPPLNPSRRLPAADGGRSGHMRALALIEVVVCSGFPTQIALATLLAWLGWGSIRGFEIGVVAPLLLADTVLLTGLIVLFLRVHGESPREAFFGGRPWRGELRAAIPMVAKAYGIALVVLLTLAVVAPWLHTVQQNPLQNLLKAPGDAAVFALVVIIAGGIREEVQRAFILRRFEQWLGGPRVGLAISSVAFGAGHLVQGADAAIATGLLGAFWGASYLHRRSVIAPVVSHAAFDLLQIAIFLMTGR